MIRVLRDDSNKPAGFNERSAKWRKQLELRLAADKKATVSMVWGELRAEIRPDADVLKEVFAHKCAFCESWVRHVSNPHVEHYRPKGRAEFRDRVFDWNNWLNSCGKCNEGKWAHFPLCGGEPCLLDPANDDPAMHLDFVDAKVMHYTERGNETIGLLKLDRPPLEDHRESWLTTIQTLLLLAANVPDAREDARELLIWSMQADAPYAAMTRRYIIEVAPRLASPNVPHATIQVTEPRQRIQRLIRDHARELRELT